MRYHSLEGCFDPRPRPHPDLDSIDTQENRMTLRTWQSVCFRLQLEPAVVAGRNQGILPTVRLCRSECLFSEVRAQPGRPPRDTSREQAGINQSGRLTCKPGGARDPGAELRSRTAGVKFNLFGLILHWEQRL